VTKHCLYCEKAFEARDPRQKYCKKSHRIKNTPSYKAGNRRRSKEGKGGSAPKQRVEHHRRIRRYLGSLSQQGETVSRTCPRNCLEIYIGQDNWHGKKRDYPLCANRDHYILESLEENQARNGKVA